MVNINSINIINNNLEIKYKGPKADNNAYYYETVSGNPENTPSNILFNLIEIKDSSTELFSKGDIIYFDKSDPYSKNVDINTNWYGTIYGSWLSENLYDLNSTKSGVAVKDIFNNYFKLKGSLNTVVSDIKTSLKGDAENYLFFNRFSLYNIPDDITWGLTPINKENFIGYNPFSNNSNYIIGKIAFLSDQDSTISNLEKEFGKKKLKPINDAKGNKDIVILKNDTVVNELYFNNVLLIYYPSSSYKGYYFGYINSTKPGYWDSVENTIKDTMENKKSLNYTDFSNTLPIEYLPNINKLYDYNNTNFLGKNDEIKVGTDNNLSIVMYDSNNERIDINSLNEFDINVQHPFIAHGNNSNINNNDLEINDIFQQYSSFGESDKPILNQSLKANINLDNIYTTANWAQFSINYNIYSVITDIILNIPKGQDLKFSDYIFYPTSTEKNPNISKESNTKLFTMLTPTITKKTKKNASGEELPQLTCDNPFGTVDKGTQPSYPLAMFTPYIDLGLYPPELSNGGGILWPNGYTTKGTCLEGNTYVNTGSYGSEQGGVGNQYGYMTTMDSGSNIKGSRFLTLAFLVSARGYVQQGNENELDIRPCFGGVNTSTQVWMYDTMAKYYWNENNSLDKWIGSMRTYSNDQNDKNDIILSYGGYNNRMSADTLWNILNATGAKLTEDNLCSDIANYKGLKNLEIDITILEKYGIKDVNTEHDKDKNYQWGYTGKDKPTDLTQYRTNLYACYYLPMKYYKVRWLDFDVEAAAQGVLNWPSQILRILALRKLMMENPNVYVRYTFPTFPIGLDRGYPILYLTMYAFQDCDVSVRRRLYVNLMTMDYGDITSYGFTDSTSNPICANKDPPNEKCDIMGKAALFAVCNCVLQMQAISDTIYKGNPKYTPKNGKDFWLMDGQEITTWKDSYYAHIGNTPMTGLNDITTEMFSPLSANVLKDFVNNSKQYFYSENQDGPPGLTEVSPIWTNSDYMKDYFPPNYTSLYYSDSGSQTLYDYLTANTGGFTNGSGHIAMWSLQRDTPCERGEGGTYVSTSCSSSIPHQTVMQFSQIFQETQNAINDSL